MVLLVLLVVAPVLHFHCATYWRSCITGNNFFFVHYFQEVPHLLSNTLWNLQKNKARLCVCTSLSLYDVHLTQGSSLSVPLNGWPLVQRVSRHCLTWPLTLKDPEVNWLVLHVSCYKFYFYLWLEEGASLNKASFCSLVYQRVSLQ